MGDVEARGSLLETLRLARGLTQADLALTTAIAQGTLSKVESGLVALDDGRWQLIAQALDVPLSAFEAAGSRLRPARVFHRKRRSTPVGALRKIGADASLVQRRIGDLLGVDQGRLRRYDLDDGFVTPQEVAQAERIRLGLGDSPIDDLVGLVESTGAIVIRWPLESIQVDAIAAWPDGAAPIVLIGEHVPAERQRFTVAHELGHALMHGEDETESQEQEADTFAAEFLMPIVRVRHEWPAIADLQQLIRLKRRWGISLAALVRRGYDAGLLSDREYRSWNIRLSTSGMHRREPESVAAERPSALQSAIRSELGRGFSVGDLAERAHMNPREFADTFMESR